MPILYEHMVLQNRNILADQMDYLRTGIPKHSRVVWRFEACEGLKSYI